MTATMTKRGARSWSQWLGFGVVLLSLVLLALYEHRAARPLVALSENVEDALGAGALMQPASPPRSRPGHRGSASGTPAPATTPPARQPTT
jgi:hypothetical protein